MESRLLSSARLMARFRHRAIGFGAVLAALTIALFLVVNLAQRTGRSGDQDVRHHEAQEEPPTPAASGKSSPAGADGESSPPPRKAILTHGVRLEDLQRRIAASQYAEEYIPLIVALEDAVFRSKHAEAHVEAFRKLLRSANSSLSTRGLIGLVLTARPSEETRLAILEELSESGDLAPLIFRRPLTGQ